MHTIVKLCEGESIDNTINIIVNICITHTDIRNDYASSDLMHNDGDLA